jgi:phage replication O-like protein O
MKPLELEANFTLIPHFLLDEVMRSVSHAQFKIVMAIARKTYGWNKKQDRISLSQLAEQTGVTQSKIPGMVRSLGDLIKCEHSPLGNVYQINVNAAPDGKLELYPEGTTGCILREHTKETLSGSLRSPDIPLSQSPSLIPRDDLIGIVDSKREDNSLGNANSKGKGKAKDKGMRIPIPGREECLAWWSGVYLERTGIKYHWTGKDIALATTLFKQYGDAEFRRIAQILFDTTDPYLKKLGLTIGTLSNQWNKLVSTAPEPREKIVNGIRYDTFSGLRIWDGTEQPRRRDRGR